MRIFEKAEKQATFFEAQFQHSVSAPGSEVATYSPQLTPGSPSAPVHVMQKWVSHFLYPPEDGGRPPRGGLQRNLAILSEFDEDDTHPIFKLDPQAYGDRIVPGSLSVRKGGLHMMDDGFGNLLMESDDRVFVGNVFYGLGIGVITTYGTNSFRVPEDPADLFALDPETAARISTPFSESGAVNFVSSFDQFEWRSGVEVIELEVISKAQSFKKSSNPQRNLDDPPFVSKVGLYDSEGGLVAVSSPAVPVRLSSSAPTTFLSRIDF